MTSDSFKERQHANNCRVQKQAGFGCSNKGIFQTGMTLHCHPEERGIFGY